MVITKPFAFARNTLDTEICSMLFKDARVAVFWRRNINTSLRTVNCPLILSSVAQQEVENISANVKKGLKMKMQGGELVGFQVRLGYDYNPADCKTITINEEEAAVVRYIFLSDTRRRRWFGYCQTLT